MKRSLWIFAALVPITIVCGGAKIASDQFIGRQHDPRLVGVWKGRWAGLVKQGAKSDIRLDEDGTGMVKGRAVTWDTDDSVLHIQVQGKNGMEIASVRYNLGRRGSAVAFDGGPQDIVPLVMARV